MTVNIGRYYKIKLSISFNIYDIMGK